MTKHIVTFTTVTEGELSAQSWEVSDANMNFLRRVLAKRYGDPDSEVMQSTAAAVTSARHMMDQGAIILSKEQI